MRFHCFSRGSWLLVSRKSSSVFLPRLRRVVVGVAPSCSAQMPALHWGHRLAKPRGWRAGGCGLQSGDHGTKQKKAELVGPSELVGWKMRHISYICMELSSKILRHCFLTPCVPWTYQQNPNNRAYGCFGVLSIQEPGLEWSPNCFRIYLKKNYSDPWISFGRYHGIVETTAHTQPLYQWR